MDARGFVSSLVAALIAGSPISAASHAQTPPPAASLRTATQAAAALRRLYFLEEGNDGADLGDTLVRRYPSSGAVRAWYVANLRRAGESHRIDSIGAHIDSTTRDPWLLATKALARMYPMKASNAAMAEARRLAFRARALAPRDSDIAWVATYTIAMADVYSRTSNAPHAMSFIDSVAPTVHYPTSLRVMRAEALYKTSLPSSPGANAAPDTAKRAAAMRELAAVRAVAPTNLAAFFSAATWARVGQPDTALALMKQAVAIAPRSPTVHHWYWIIVDGQSSLSGAEKRAIIRADCAAFLAATDSTPWALATAAEFLPHLDRDATVRELEDRILVRAPRSRWAEDVLFRRASAWNDSLYAARNPSTPPPKPDTILARARYAEAMQAFIAKPWVANPATRAQAVVNLFLVVRDDPTYPSDKLVALVKQLLDAPISVDPSLQYGEVARVLAERKVEPAVAERAARDGIAHVASYFADAPNSSYSTLSIGEQAALLDMNLATLHGELGLAFASTGRFADAEAEMRHGIELSAKNPVLYRDLGRLLLAQGRNDEAELTFAQGLSVYPAALNPNQKELSAIYEKNHGSTDGWAAYLDALGEKERTARRARILARRDTTASTVAPFRLPDLLGRLVDSDSLRGRIVVLNFWGTWCGPCVAEMPQIQQFYDKYRNDPSVAVLTISNDKDLQVLKEWVAKRGLTVPTLVDNGFVANAAHVSSFPTTWFINPDGHAEYSAIAGSATVVEEWTWRVEAMKARKGVPGKPVP